MPIDKLISFHIERQFPSVFREQGQELVQFVKEYYKFLETSENQTLYNGRRIFEYRDIDTTLDSMLKFFKNKYLADLPFDDPVTINIIVKNILGLYRRKGTEGGLEQFFRLFYNESIKVYYPARDLFKPSDSNWRSGNFLQMIPNSGIFTSTKIAGEFTYNDIINRTIIGVASRSRATVNKINLIKLNNSITPIIFINDITGIFLGLEGIVCEIDGVPINFGVINGSLTSIQIDTLYPGPGGNRVGDLVTFRTSPDGIGATGVVTEISDSFTGSIQYELEDGGWGYSIENTKLLVSDQLIFLNNEESDFTLLETLEDDFGNRGIVVGQNDVSVGVKMDANTAFTSNSTISAVDRSANTIISFALVTPKNNTSPGDLYPDTLDVTDVIVGDLTNIENVRLITDIIDDYTLVTIDAADYNDPPALQPMSGNTSPITANTALEDAFGLGTGVNIGSIVRFDNLNPGNGYVNNVFALPYDVKYGRTKRKNQLITLESIPAILAVGDEVAQGLLKGRVVAINNNTITVRPFSYSGFSDTLPVTYGEIDWNVLGISTDFDGDESLGINAVMNTNTDYATGRIKSVRIVDSGYGYIHNSIADVIGSNGQVVSRGTLSARGEGSTGGFWSSFNSHVNGYVTKNGNLEYYNSGKFIQDSNYYQEYSYEVQSKLDINVYESSLKDITHIAGTKVFGRFNLEEIAETPISSRIEIVI